MRMKLSKINTFILLYIQMYFIVELIYMYFVQEICIGFYSVLNKDIILHVSKVSELTVHHNKHLTCL